MFSFSEYFPTILFYELKCWHACLFLYSYVEIIELVSKFLRQEFPDGCFSRSAHTVEDNSVHECYMLEIMGDSILSDKEENGKKEEKNNPFDCSKGLFLESSLPKNHSSSGN